MKRLVLFFVSINFLGLFSCEKNAGIADFLSPNQVESIITGEEDCDQSPLNNIAQVLNEPFTAICFKAVISGGQIVLNFEDEDSNIIALTVFGTTSETYTAGLNSQNVFIGELELDDVGFFTTSENVTQDAFGSLILEVNTAESTVSGTFSFTAFNEGGESTDVAAGNFTDIELE